MQTILISRCETATTTSRNMQIKGQRFFSVKLCFAYMLIDPSLGCAKNQSQKELEKATQAVSDLWVKAPVADEVCFSPNEPCDVKLVKFIQSAQKSLDIAIFDMTLDKVAHEILVQSKKIPVRIVVDRREAKGQHSLIPLLIKAGANVKIGRQRGIMHNKFTLVDGKILETGSFNYTNGAAFKNNENQIYLSTPSVVERYKAQFEKIWESAALPQ
jgi:phosphatidylserine/phosphatidylglycerophosphate/cardiolipin synthase-like enzyme